jgi:DNA-binding response OmpR family regulator
LSSNTVERSEPPPILVVEHDPEVGGPLVEQLAADGYRARLVRTAEHARVLAHTLRPSVALLGDLESPRAALELLAEIRGGGSTAPTGTECPWPAGLPVIVVGSRSQEPDLLRAFEAGTDDFIARPASYLELRARLRALLLRTAASRTGSYGFERVAVGPLEIDPRAHVVTLHGYPLPLRRLEYALLLHLAREPQRVFAKEDLLRAVWGYPTSVCTRTLDSHASRLRRKLCVESGERWVVNVRGVGYRLI